MDKYRILSKKGEGTFSEVLKCINTREGTYWACKKMKQRYQSAEEVKSIREIQALRTLSNCPYILQLQEVIFERKSGTLNLIFELMDMNLYELIRSQRTYFSDEKSAAYMLQLLKAVEHMHKYGYFHRDIKPENILIKGDLLKLADFGSVRKINTAHPYTEYISTRWYRAPECLLTDGFYSYPMDIWSVGCVMFEILTLQPLFPGSNEIDQIDKIHNILGTPDPSLLEKFRLQSRNIRYSFKPKKGIGLQRYMPDYPRDAVELISTLCTYDPDHRVSANRALKHQYFDSIKEILANNEKENEERHSSSETESVERQSKLSSSEPNSVLEIRSENTNELFKPILKRKKYTVKNISHLNPMTQTTLINKPSNHHMLTAGASLSALNQTNSTSFSVLSNYSDSTNQALSAAAARGHLKYPIKKNYITFGAAAPNTNAYHAAHQQPLLLPKLSNSSNSLQYVQYAAANGNPTVYHHPHQHHHQQHHHLQSSPTMHNIFTKMGNMNAAGNTLPDLYFANGHLIENKIIGAGPRLHTKY